jgi:hypothetical protein
MLKTNYTLAIFISILLTLMLVSCGPTIHFLGDAHAPTSTVDLYYDTKEVTKEYKVIGRMTNDQYINYDVEDVKKEMIKKAKQVGADGIIFSDLNVENTRSQGDKLAVKAELIRYR